MTEETWNPNMDEAPRDGTEILLGDFRDNDDREHSIGIAMWNGYFWKQGGEAAWYWSGQFAPTHWMPLPAPPQRKE